MNDKILDQQFYKKINMLYYDLKKSSFHLFMWIILVLIIESVGWLFVLL